MDKFVECPNCKTSFDVSTYLHHIDVSNNDDSNNDSSNNNRKNIQKKGRKNKRTNDLSKNTSIGTKIKEKDFDKDIISCDEETNYCVRLLLLIFCSYMFYKYIIFNIIYYLK